MYKLKRARCLIISTITIVAVGLLFAAGNCWAKNPIKLRYYTGMPPSHHFCVNDMAFFAEEVKKQTNGEVIVEVYPAGQLFSFIQGIDAATMGGVEMGLTAVGHWAGYNPVFKFSDFFLLIEDIDHWLKARDEIDPVLQPLFNKHNVKVLFYSAYGGNSNCGKIAINQLTDMKGLKIRAPVPGAMACLEAWGATPTRIAASEVYDALSKGAIDGCVTSWSFMNAMKLYEVSDQYVGPFWWTVWVNFINMDTWNSIPKNHQDTILKIAAETEKKSVEWMKAYEDKSLDKLKADGKVKLLTPHELKEWKAPLTNVYNSWVEECGKKGFENEAKQILGALTKAQ